MAFMIVDDDNDNLVIPTPAKKAPPNQGSTLPSSDAHIPQNFPLLDLPRELRDRVYCFCVFRPQGIRHKHHRATTRSDKYNAYKELEVLPLFLTCKQVYQESLRIFCRYNCIEINTRNVWVARKSRRDWALPGTLRLFPQPYGQMLQRMSRKYSQASLMLHWKGPGRYPDKGDPIGLQWTGIVGEALYCKKYFPSLREFTVFWHVAPDVLKERDNLDFTNMKSEDKVALWLRWMRYWATKCDVRPPPWIRFELHPLSIAYPITREHEEELNEAYQVLCEELRVPEYGVVSIEDSGRKWLEEAWSEGSAAKRKRKKKDDMSS